MNLNTSELENADSEDEFGWEPCQTQNPFRKWESLHNDCCTVCESAGELLLCDYCNLAFCFRHIPVPDEIGSSNSFKTKQQTKKRDKSQGYAGSVPKGEWACPDCFADQKRYLAEPATAERVLEALDSIIIPLSRNRENTRQHYTQVLSRPFAALSTNFGSHHFPQILHGMCLGCVNSKFHGGVTASAQTRNMRGLTQLLTQFAQ